MRRTGTTRTGIVLLFGAVLLRCTTEAGSTAVQIQAGAGMGNALAGGAGGLGQAGLGGATPGTGGTGGAGAANGASGAGGLGQGGSIDPNAGEGGSNGVCAQQAITYSRATPTAELLVDRSGSMAADFGTYDRWNAIRNILVDPLEGLVVLTQGDVRFGLSLYTGFTLEDPGGPSCPDLIQVPIALNNYQAIHDVFMATEVGSATPTGESLVAVTSKLEAFAEPGPKAIVLATDGDPDTCLDPDSSGTQPPRLVAEAAVEAAWVKGIRTYVIAVGDEIADLVHVQSLAEIGSGGDPTAAYYPATDANALVTAFASIFAELSSCDLTLNGTVDPTDANRGLVTIGGGPIVYGDANGWEMPDPSTLRLLGAACSQLKSGTASVNIAFPCGTFNMQ
jgi:hypothetical protein